MSNMDDFNEATATVLAKLYEAFPQRLTFKVANLVEGADDNKQRNYGDTILFLEREGFIRYEARVTNEYFEAVSLTSKGLAILNSTPDVLKEKTPLGNRLGSVVREGSKELIKAVVEQVIKGTFGT
jgi:hypothetical protein